MSEINTSSDLDRFEKMIDTGVHITDVVLFNSLKAKLESQLEDFAKLPDCKHSCDCTDCQQKCLRCAVELRESKLESKVKELEEENTKFNTHFESQLNKIKLLHEQGISLAKISDSHKEKLEQYKAVIDEIKKSFENDGICCVRCYGLSRKSLKEILSKVDKK